MIVGSFTIFNNEWCHWILVYLDELNLSIWSKSSVAFSGSAIQQNRANMTLEQMIRILETIKDDRLCVSCSFPFILPWLEESVRPSQWYIFFDRFIMIYFYLVSMDWMTSIFNWIIKGSWEAILPCYGQIELWDLTLMKGGVCLLHRTTIHHKRIIGYDTGWCETWHHITIHHKRIRGYDTGWSET